MSEAVSRRPDLGHVEVELNAANTNAKRLQSELFEVKATIRRLELERAPLVCPFTVGDELEHKWHETRRRVLVGTYSLHLAR